MTAGRAKRLGVNALRLSGVRTGVARYAACLIEEWQRLQLPFAEVLLFSPRPLPPEVLPRDRRFRNVVLGPDAPGLIWEQIVLPARATGVDVLFCPGDGMPALWRGRCVVTNQGYTREFAESFTRWEKAKSLPVNRYAARRADRLISPSETILRTMQEALGVSVERSRVRLIPLAAGAQFAVRDPSDPRVLEVGRRYGLHGLPYLLFVGKLSRRRHVPDLLGALSDLSSRFPHRLLLVGPNSVGLDLGSLVRSLGLEERVVYPGYVPDADLPWLYAGAELFVLPTEGEGFSLTVLEAMQSGIPVVTLDRPNMIEVAGGAAMLLPDGSRETLGRALAGLLDDAAARDELRRRGLARVRELTWERTARETMDVLWEAAAG